MILYVNIFKYGMKDQSTYSSTSANEHPIKILQFGGGNFLRGFFNYIVQVLNLETQFEASVIVIKPTAKGSYKDLRKQNGCFYLLQEGYLGEELKSELVLINNIRSVVNPYNEWDQYMASAKIPSIKYVVSNTTEAGIRYVENEKFENQPAHEFPAKLTQWLYKRFEHFNGDDQKGCCFLPSELIENNGLELKQCILRYAADWNLGDDFENWIENQNVFYNTLVDRIVSGFPKTRAEALQKEIAYQDKLLVASEYYLSWVIEGPDKIQTDFPVSKTNLNIKFVKDLSTYRKIKVRILNGAHTALVPVAYMCGIDLVRNSLEDKAIETFLRKVVYEDILPVLKMDQKELEEFAQSVFERFSNPYIDHELLSISLNSISKFKTRLLPTIIDSIKDNNRIPKHILFSLAALILFYKGKRNNMAIQLKDEPQVLQFFTEKWDLKTHHAISYKALCIQVLSNKLFWGIDLNVYPEISDQLCEYLQAMDKKGMTVALKEFLNL